MRCLVEEVPLHRWPYTLTRAAGPGYWAWWHGQAVAVGISLGDDNRVARYVRYLLWLVGTGAVAAAHAHSDTGTATLAPGARQRRGDARGQGEGQAQAQAQPPHVMMGAAGRRWARRSPLLLLREAADAGRVGPSCGGGGGGGATATGSMET